MCKAILVTDGTVINLADSATSTLSFLSSFEKHRRDMIASQCSETVQDLLPDTNLRYLPCEVHVTVLKSGFIYDGFFCYSL